MNTIGIDLGTYNSAAAVALGRDRVVMVESLRGRTIFGKNFPSFVLFDHNGNKQAVGKSAKEELSINPELVIWGAKRLVGLTYSAAKKNGELDRFQYDIEEGPNGGILINVAGERYAPEHILEFIFREIKQDAENSRANPLLGGVVEKAVITVPAYYMASRTKPIELAALAAGFSEVETIAEPTAAAICYGLDLDKEATVLAFDMGAGTLDVSIMQFIDVDGELVTNELCTSGNEALGGINMDEELISYLIDKNNLSSIAEDASAKGMLTEESEKAKVNLSTMENTQLLLPDRRNVDISRSILEGEIKTLLDDCRGPIRVAIEEAEITAGDLDHVIFVGGPTFMPCVRRLVKEELKNLGASKKLLRELEAMENKLPVNPMECVAQGASLKAAKLVKTGGTTIAEGYGTIFGDDYYQEIIHPHSPYPISAEDRFSHGNPNALTIPYTLVAKRRDTGDTNAPEPTYKYYYLGNFTLPIRPVDYGLPAAKARLQITHDKSLVLTLTQTDLAGPNPPKITYEGLDLLKGEEIELQEDDNEIWTEEDIKEKIERARESGGRREWTEDHKIRLCHAAQEAIALVKDGGKSKVRKKTINLDSALGDVGASGNIDLNRTCTSIFTGTLELLDALRHAGQISEMEFRSYLEQITRIARHD